jgi:hypothetical protein
METTNAKHSKYMVHKSVQPIKAVLTYLMLCKHLLKYTVVLIFSYKRQYFLIFCPLVGSKNASEGKGRLSLNCTAINKDYNINMRVRTYLQLHMNLICSIALLAYILVNGLVM